MGLALSIILPRAKVFVGSRIVRFEAMRETAPALAPMLSENPRDLNVADLSWQIDEAFLGASEATTKGFVAEQGAH